MLNISPNRINKDIDAKRYAAMRRVSGFSSGMKLIRVMTGISVIVLIFLFLPWTQNIRSEGNLTTLRPDQRPQTVHSIIPGRIEQWYVIEGQFVNKGDTILHLSEIKDEYFDPELLDRTREQMESKRQAVESYTNKVKAMERNISALIETSKLKLKQAENKLKQAHLKVASDSMDNEAYLISFQIAEERFKRMEQLYKDGLKSLTDYESRKMSFQKAQADKISAGNKLLTSRNEVLNAQVELSSIQAQYRDEIAKAESEKYTAESNLFDAQAAYAKLRNQFNNYTVRSGMYFITAPQSGYVTQTLQTGIGETIKEGDEIVSIMPAKYDLAVVMYVEPIDMPLLAIGQEVRIQFDGWPAIVFSGWPNTSYGTYGGRIFAMDNFISLNGKYRVLVAPDNEEQPWPEALRVGAGTSSLILLNNVPVWYELWRQLNGFPPDYYAGNTTEEKK